MNVFKIDYFLKPVDFRLQLIVDMVDKKQAISHEISQEVLEQVRGSKAPVVAVAL